MDFIKYATALLFLCATLSANGQNLSNQDYIKHIVKEKMRKGIPEIDNPNSSNLNTSSNNGSNLEQNLSEASDIQATEPYIAINPTDSDNMVVSYINFKTSEDIFNFPLYFTRDGGETWTKSSFSTEDIYAENPVPDYSIVGGGDPIFAFDSNGKLYFSWIYFPANLSTLDGRFLVYWAFSEDGGENWTVPEGDDKFIEVGNFNITNFETGDFGTGLYDRPWFDVDRTGGVNDGVLYSSGLFIPASNSTESRGIVVKRKLPAVDAFEPERVLIPGTVSPQVANIRVDNLGNVHVTFAEYSGGKVNHSVSTDGGQSFSVPNLIGNFNYNPGVTLVEDRENPAINLALNRANNNMYVVWNSQEGQLNGYFSYSTDAGETWSPAQNISDLAGLTGNQVYMPVVSVNENNEVSISWHSLNSEDSGGYLTMQSTDGGLSWESPIETSAAQTNFGTLAGSAFFGDYTGSVKSENKTISVWADGRSVVSSQIYVGVVDYNILSSNLPEVTPVTDKISVKSLYPNPSDNEITLDINLHQESELSVSILDTTGKTIKEFDTAIFSQGNSKSTYGVSELSSGLYFVLIDSKWGKTTRKFSKI